MSVMSHYKVDTHLHVFEPGLRTVASPRYVPDYAARLAQLQAVMADAAVQFGVLIQPSFLGTDNTYLCRALREAPQQMRGIAVIDETCTADELNALAAAGVVGIRFNLDGVPVPQLTKGAWPELLREIRRRDWQAEVHCEAARLPEILPSLLAAEVNIVVDHFGRPAAEQGTNDPGFRYLLQCASSQRVWVKLSAPYRNGGKAIGEALAPELAAQLQARFGIDRLLWGSDWPHTRNEHAATMTGALTALTKWLPTAGAQRAVLCANALALYQFNTEIVEVA